MGLVNSDEKTRRQNYFADEHGEVMKVKSGEINDPANTILNMHEYL